MKSALGLFTSSIGAIAFAACSQSGDTSAPPGAGGSTSASTSSIATSTNSSNSTATTAANGSSTAATTGASTGTTGATGSGGGAAMDPPGWKLVWSDEFDGADGADVDPTKWVHVESGDGNGNQEREYYTPGTANAYQGGGDLHIVAKALPAGGGGFKCWYGACQYTSGKIVTKDWGKPSLFEKVHGRFTARMKIPAGQGVWPAFWLLGNNIEQVNWPTCGEIDVMENIGKQPATLFGTIHGPDANKNNVSEGGSTDLAMGGLADDFHTYTIEWKDSEVRFLLDDVSYFTATPPNLPGTWVFDDHPYCLLLNLAIGGGWPGDPDNTTKFPSEMLVDWVRVYDPT